MTDAMTEPTAPQPFIPHQHIVVSTTVQVTIDLNAWQREYDVGHHRAVEMMHIDVRDTITAAFTALKWEGLVCEVKVDQP